MRLKELERWLSQCDQFDSPKVELEQYATSAHIAARMLYAAQDDIQGGSVCDLGSGCGILSIGSALVGAAYVCGVEADDDAIRIALQNCRDMFEEDDCEGAAVDFVNLKIDLQPTPEISSYHLCGFSNLFDVVIMNPPFGTKGNAGADFKFLREACALTRPGGRIYSLHKSSTRDFFKKQLLPTGGLPGVEGQVLAEVRYDLPKCYKFHKERSVDIAVDFWLFEKV